MRPHQRSHCNCLLHDCLAESLCEQQTGTSELEQADSLWRCEGGHGYGQGKRDCQEEPKLGAIHAAQALLDAGVCQKRKEDEPQPRKADRQRNLVWRQVEPALQGEYIDCVIDSWKKSEMTPKGQGSSSEPPPQAESQALMARACIRKVLLSIWGMSTAYQSPK